MKLNPSPTGGTIQSSPEATPLPGSSTADQALPVFHLKEILVPVDFSSCSRKALLYAIPFAKQFGARITVVHVAPYCVRPSEVVVADSQILDASREALDNLVKEISSSAEVHAVVRVGNPASEIVDAAVDLQSDLIVISTHGKSGLAYMLLGSTAERVVQHAPCPVLVVREKEHEFVRSSPDSFNRPK